MLIRATKAHVLFLLKRRSAQITFALLFAVVLLRFVVDVLEFRGYDVIAMYHPMKLLSLSYNHIYYNANTVILLSQLFPLLVAFPAGLSLAADQASGAQTVLLARLGPRRYTASKILAVIIATAILFTLPFLMEMVLNCIAFPLQATGDMSNLNIYDPQHIAMTDRYWLPELYHFSPYLYAVVGILRFGLFAGLLAGFTAALSTFIRIKYRAFLLLPVFLLLFYSISLEDVSLRWYNYALLFADEPKNHLFGAGLYVLPAVFCLLAVLCSGWKDYRR